MPRVRRKPRPTAIAERHLTPADLRDLRVLLEEHRDQIVETVVQRLQGERAKVTHDTPAQSFEPAGPYPRYRGDRTREFYEQEPGNFQPKERFMRRWTYSNFGDSTIRNQAAAGKIRTVHLTRYKVLYYVPDVERANPYHVGEERQRRGGPAGQGALA